MTPRIYAKALFESVIAHPQHLPLYVKNLKSKLKTGGKKELLASVAKELYVLITQKEHQEKITVSVAHEKDVSGIKNFLSQTPFTAYQNGKIEKKINPHLVGGIRIETWDKRFDGSYKRKLLNLYDTLITK